MAMDVSWIMDYMELIEEMEMETLNSKQMNAIRNRYNAYVRFCYGVLEDENYFVMSMSSRDFNLVEYYFGFEYIREGIIFKVESSDEVLVVYDMDGRVESLLELLEENKED